MRDFRSVKVWQKAQKMTMETYKRYPFIEEVYIDIRTNDMLRESAMGFMQMLTADS